MHDIVLQILLGRKQNSLDGGKLVNSDRSFCDAASGDQPLRVDSPREHHKPRYNNQIYVALEEQEGI
jgi:hypothetical protein